jgi:hypothetical protein
MDSHRTSNASEPGGGREPSSPLLIVVRYVLPAVVVVAGVILFALNPNVNSFEGAAALIGAGLSVLLLNVLHRTGVRGDAERAQEDEARRYFDAHGHWPDERPARAVR